MADVVEVELSAIPDERRALLVEDKDGAYDFERRVAGDAMGGRTFYWSATSIQADFESTVTMAKRWAEKHGLDRVYLAS